MSIVARHLISLWSRIPNSKLRYDIKKAFEGRVLAGFMVASVRDLQHTAVNQIECLFQNESRELQESVLSLKNTVLQQTRSTTCVCALFSGAAA